MGSSQGWPFPSKSANGVAGPSTVEHRELTLVYMTGKCAAYCSWSRRLDCTRLRYCQRRLSGRTSTLRRSTGGLLFRLGASTSVLPAFHVG